MTARIRRTFPALLALLLALPSAAHAQRRITGEGTEGFRALLKRGKGLNPLESFEEVRQADPKNVIVVLFRGTNAQGEVQPFLPEGDALDLRNFVNGGGALWVATDVPLPRGFAQGFGVSVGTSHMFARDARSAYMRKAECPYVARVGGSVPNLFVRPEAFRRPEFETDELDHVATNRPAFLDSRTTLPTLAVFPGGTWSREGAFIPALDSPFAMGRRFDEGGKFLIMADHSVFINSMLLPRGAPNDNLAFASNSLNWLMAGDSRSYVLFIEDGKIWKRDDYQNLIITSLPGQNPEDIAQFMWENRDLLWKNSDLAEQILGNLEHDGILEEVEKSDLLGSILDNNLEPWMIAKLVLILGAIGLFGYAALAFMGSRYKFPKRVARLSLQLDRLRPRAGLLEMRLRTGLGRGRYYELARQKAREMFADLKLTPAEEGPLPKVEIDAGWLKRGRILRNLRKVWAVGFGPEPVAITARQWTAWRKKQDEIEQLIRDGVIRFQ
jgi:hypothetical protein